MTAAHIRRVVELVQTGDYATQTAIGQHLGLSPVAVTKLKARAIGGGLITGEAWQGYLRVARDRKDPNRIRRVEGLIASDPAG